MAILIMQKLYGLQSLHTLSPCLANANQDARGVWHLRSACRFNGGKPKCWVLQPLWVLRHLAGDDGAAWGV